MTDLDLTNINPQNWERARARARAVQAYLDLPKKSGTERDKFAASLGISPNLFSRLVAAWRAGKGVDALMVSGKQSRRESTRLPARTREIMRSAITLYGAKATLKEIREAIIARCAAEGVTAPCQSTIHVYQLDAYHDLQAANVEPMIVVGELSVTLPCIADDRTIVRPNVLVAVDVASRNIVSFRVTAQSAETILFDLLSEVRRREERFTVILDEALTSFVSSAQVGKLGLSFESQASVRRRLRRTFGSRLHDLGLIYRQAAAASPEQMLARKGGQAVSFKTAVLAVELAVRQHNNEWPPFESDVQAAA